MQLLNDTSSEETASDLGTVDVLTEGSPQFAVKFEERLVFNDGFERKKTAALLFFGSVMGLCGFLFAFLIGFLKFTNPFMSEYHRQFPSHWGYFPATVSEMVHDPEDPAGKCFAAFASIGATFIFLSWYPWRLRNVYMGDSITIWCSHNLSWMMFRQFIPTTGMMLVASVTTTPFAQATMLDNICLGIHLTGALMFFAGYCLVEAVALGWGPFPLPEVSRRTMGSLEIRLRKSVVTAIIAFYSVFCVLQGVLLLPLDTAHGHADQWRQKVAYDEFGFARKKMLLLDTATGFVLFLKIASYTSEVLGGLLLIASHLIIWGFCNERYVDLYDELWKVV
mmetsp:Transcript_51799/g.138661  ORF Transcript_51799/g.138661 Transcript_51799/m.138661 type:complete len:336 (-) Transcript_51799:142-1149(-)